MNKNLTTLVLLLVAGFAVLSLIRVVADIIMKGVP